VRQRGEEKVAGESGRRKRGSEKGESRWATERQNDRQPSGENEEEAAAEAEEEAGEGGEQGNADECYIHGAEQQIESVSHKQH